MSREDSLWYQVWREDKAQFLITRLWCVSIGNGSSIMFNSLDESMVVFGGECIWIITFFLLTQLAQPYIWLMTVMVHFSDLAFLSGSDEEDIVGLLLKNMCKEIPLFLLQVICKRFCKAKIKEC